MQGANQILLGMAKMFFFDFLTGRDEKGKKRGEEPIWDYSQKD